MTLRRRLSWGVLASVMVVLAFARVGAAEFRDVARWFPSFLSVAGLLVGVAIVVFDVRDRRLGRAERVAREGLGDDDDAGVFTGFVRQMIWLLGLTASLWALGGPLGIAVWLLGFLRVESKEGPLVVVSGALGMAFVMSLLASVLGLRVPAGNLIESGQWLPS